MRSSPTPCAALDVDENSADNGLIDLGVKMVPDVQIVQAGYESNWRQSLQAFKTLQSFKNATLITGDFRVQSNRDEISQLPARAVNRGLGIFFYRP
jgi:hypothetical protein